MKRPYIICHMMMSVDGRIDCGMTEKIGGADSYYEILNSFEADGALSGRVTAELEMAEPGKFVIKNSEEAGVECFSVKRKGLSYQIVTDTHGTLLWKDDHKSEEPLIIIMSETAKKEYLEYLDSLGISWIVTGKDKIDIPRAMEILSSEFGIKKLAVVGGGNINGAFLDKGILDEVSILIGPGIDGRKGMAAVFDGLQAEREPFRLQLKEVRSYENGAVWLHYTVM